MVNRQNKPFWEVYSERGPADEKGLMQRTQRYVDEAATVSREQLNDYDHFAEDYVLLTLFVRRYFTSEASVEQHRALALAYIDAISARGFQSGMTKEDINASHDQLIEELRK